MTRNAWRALKLAACLAVAFDFMTPGLGLIGGVFDPAVSAAAAPVGNVFQYNPTNPAALTSLTTAKMVGAGYSGEFTPRADGTVLVTVSGDIQNSVAATATTIQLMYGTGNAPANAATYTGQACGTITTTSPATGNIVPFSITCAVTGLAINTSYWFDISAGSGSSATVTPTSLNFSGAEE